MSAAVDVLDELAYVMHEQGYCGEVCVCVDDARALLPVIDRIANERAAAELEKAANDPELAHVVSLETDVGVFPHRVVAVADLYARAAALRAATTEDAHPCSGRFCRTCADEATS